MIVIKICVRDCLNFGGQVGSNNTSLLVLSWGCLSLELSKVTSSLRRCTLSAIGQSETSGQKLSLCSRKTRMAES